MKILITSGGTRINLDLVRHIGNMSRGTFGSKIAEAFLERSYFGNFLNEITFLHAKDSRFPSKYVPDFFPTFVTFDDYAARLDEELEKQPDLIILAAAVSDYGVENYVDGKIRSGEELVIRLKPLPKLISTVRQKCPKAVLCGFKLLVNSTEEELKKAITDSIVKNGCDLVVGNDLRDIKQDNHTLLIGVSVENGEQVDFYRYSKNDNDNNQYLSQKVLQHCSLIAEKKGLC